MATVWPSSINRVTNIAHLPLPYQCAIESLDRLARDERTSEAFNDFADHYAGQYGYTLMDCHEQLKEDAWQIAVKRFAINT